MKLIGTFILVLIFIDISTLYSQQKKIIPCYTDEYMNSLFLKNPELKMQRDKQIKIDDSIMAVTPHIPTRAIRIIPVVFHIIHQYGPENIPDANVYGALKQLNEDYRMQNSDISNVRSIFKSLEADLQIEFRLARIDPDGNCTSGIDRIVSDLTVNAGDNVKSLVDWDYTKYLNIWVVQSINSDNSEGTILGYSYIPPNTNKGIDGVEIVYSEVQYGSRTLTHEVGHYFGLNHPFNGGCINDNCNTEGDRVCDTPPEFTEHFGCDYSQNSCNTDNPDLPDMVENYMCYSSCKVMFTAGQKTLTDYTFSHYRINLYSTANLKATGIFDTTNYTCIPIADFTTINNIQCLGSPVKYLNESMAGSSPVFKWYFDSGNPSSSADTNPVIDYTMTGKYSVKLKVTNSKGVDSIIKSDYISVFPSTGNSLPLVQDFEDANVMDSFGYFSEPFQNVEWQRTSNGYYSGKYSLYLNNYFNTAPGQVFYFILPPVNLTGTNDQKLTFWYSFAKQISTNTDNLKIYLSYDCGKTWNILTTINQIVLPTTTDLYSSVEFKATLNSLWKKEEVDLSSYKNFSDVFVKFQFTSGGGNSIYFDDINIGQFNTNEIQQPEIGKLNVYPVPASDKLFVEMSGGSFKIVNISLRDLLGHNIFSVKRNIVPGDNLIKFDLASYNISNGTYILTTRSDNQEYHHIINIVK